MDMGLFNKSMAARVETKPAAVNRVMLTKKVVQKAGAGASYSNPSAPMVDASTPKTKTKPARPGQRYATSFFLSLAHSTLTFPPLTDPRSSGAEQGTALVVSKLEACVPS
jgi:hypothetical protein